MIYCDSFLENLVVKLNLGLLLLPLIGGIGSRESTINANMNTDYKAPMNANSLPRERRHRNKFSTAQRRSNDFFN